MLKDKIIVITGGAGLLGQEFVRAVLENNGTAIIAEIDEKRGIQLVEQLKQSLPGCNAEFHLLDIIDTGSIQMLISDIHDKYGRIDALVNNAYPRNRNYGRKFEDVRYEDFCDNVNKNLGGYFLTSQQFLKYYCNQGFGNIISISSIYGVIAPRFEIYDGTSMTMPVEYAAIKSAILHLTRYMAKYYQKKNIRINAISLGGLLDGQPESFLKAYKANCINKGMLDPKDIKGTLAFLLSDNSQYINGQNIIVDDGFTL